MAESNRGSILNVKVFDGNGYENWSYRVKLILEQKECLSVITSDPPQETEQGYAEYKRKDVRARNVQCLADNTLEIVKEKKSAKEMLETLRQTYQKAGILSEVTLQKKLRNMKYTGQSPLNEYIVEFERTVAELKNAGGKIEKSEMVTHLLSGMPESYQAIVTAIDVLFYQDEQSISLDFVKNKLLMEEQRQKRNEEKDLAMIIYIRVHLAVRNFKMEEIRLIDRMKKRRAHMYSRVNVFFAIENVIKRTTVQCKNRNKVVQHTQKRKKKFCL